MQTLNRKLWRNLWAVKGQALAIVLVIASGVGMAVMSLSTLRSLRSSQQAYYERYRFANVFASFKRGPLSLQGRLARIPGVATVEPRIVQSVNLIVEGIAEPAVGRLVSIPGRNLAGVRESQPLLNQLHLREGRFPEPGRLEILAGESFTTANDFGLGATVQAVMNGRLRTLTIVGIALSPEYIIEINAAEMLPDFKRFGVFWMPRSDLEAAFDMEGACNDVSFTLMHGANEDDVIRRVDNVIDTWGGVGSYGRSDQTSHRFISDEITQLKAMGLVTPVIFMSVAAFLLNIVMNRMIDTQREQIAALKAFGYYDAEVSLHYLTFVGIIVACGVLIGVIFGVWMGRGLTAMYTDFFHFPVFRFEFDWFTTLVTGGACAAAALLGTWRALRSASSLPPAEAMRPKSPGVFRPSLLERLGMQSFLPQTVRMILRHISRRPLKSAFSVVGISMAFGVVVLGNFGLDALTFIVDFQFRQVQRQDVHVSLAEAADDHVRHNFSSMTGVTDVEVFRSIPVRIRHGARSERTAVMGLEEDRRLFRVMAEDGNEPFLRDDGVVVSKRLAAKLMIETGDDITIEVLEGRRYKHTVNVISTVDDMSGANAFALRPFVNRLAGDGNRISGAWLAVDPAAIDDLYVELKETPNIVGVAVKEASVGAFMETIGKNQYQMQAFVIGFAVLIAAGVVYNTARISLAERDRELATMRVLGFTTQETSFILLGELALLTVVSLPLGAVFGYGMSWWSSQSINTDLFRIPLVVYPATYAMAVIVVLVASLLSGLIVRQRLEKLDLFAVLKGKD